MVSLLTRKFNLDQYHQMAKVGIIKPEERVELLQGEIITMSPVGLRHAAGINRLNRLFNLALSEAVIVSIQNPIQLGDLSEPQPDVALLTARPDFYETSFPQAQDILLLVEVADSSLRYDCQYKVPLYAQYEIPEVWIVNLNQGCLQVYRQPQDRGYQEQIVLNDDQSVAPLCCPEAIIAVKQIFGGSSA